MSWQQGNGFAEPLPISTWTRFVLPPSKSVDWSGFRSVRASYGGCKHVFVGRVEESRKECVLVMVWEPIWAYKSFTKTVTWRRFLAQLREISSQEPVTQFVKFHNLKVWANFGRYVEVKTVNFPFKSKDKELRVQRTLEEVTPLRDPHIAFALEDAGNMSVARVGWVEDQVIHKGSEVMACLWVHTWLTTEEEYGVKRMLTGTSEANAVEVNERLEQILKREVGAIDWTTFHAWFDRL